MYYQYTHLDTCMLVCLDVHMHCTHVWEYVLHMLFIHIVHYVQVCVCIHNWVCVSVDPFTLCIMSKVVCVHSICWSL